MNGRIDNYIESLLPNKASQKRRELIRSELESHVYEQFDFYIEIGYDEETAAEKAIERFGTDEETRMAIQSGFEEVYRESKWLPVLFGLSAVLMNVLSMLFGTWITSADSNGDPSAFTVVFSTASVFLIVFLIIAAYSEGLRKSLIALGVSNLLVTFSPLTCFYPQAAIYALSYVGCYAVDYFTPLVLTDVVDYGLYGIIYYGSMALTLAFAVASFVLAAKIKKKGKPKHPSAALIAYAAVLVVTFVSLLFCGSAQHYFDNYYTWFNHREDGITEETDALFCAFDGKTDYDEAKAYLQSMGYVSAKDYAATLGRNEKKRFYRNLRECVDLDEEYEVFFKEENFFNPDDGYYYENYSNGFLFLKRGSDGRVSAKGVGHGGALKNQYGDYRHGEGRSDDVEKCIKEFSSFRIGSCEKEVLSRFGTEYGEAYTKLFTYENGTQKEYYRFYMSSELVHDALYYRTNGGMRVYAQLWFEDGVLTKGSLHYVDNSEKSCEEKTLTIE